MTGSETVALVSVIGSIIVSIISQVQNSRCTHIDCWGISCDRDVSVNADRDDGERKVT